jgi:hypothetical protein
MYLIQCSYGVPFQWTFVDGMFQDGLVELIKETFGTIEEAIAAHDNDFETLNQ